MKKKEIKCEKCSGKFVPKYKTQKICQTCGYINVIRSLNKKP